MPDDVRRIWGDDAVECEHEGMACWHHKDMHSGVPFNWGWRVRLWSAWWDTKRLVRAWKAVPRG